MDEKAIVSVHLYMCKENVCNNTDFSGVFPLHFLELLLSYYLHYGERSVGFLRDRVSHILHSQV